MEEEAPLQLLGRENYKTTRVWAHCAQYTIVQQYKCAMEGEPLHCIGLKISRKVDSVDLDDVFDVSVYQFES